MRRMPCVGACAVILWAAGCTGAAASGRLDLGRQRIVFLGDSITDGNTYPMLVRQALAEAGKPLPAFINAGIGGDTAEGMVKRLDRDVFAQRPTLVSLSVGVNDVLRGVTAEEYASRVGAIAERMNARGVPMLIMTTTVLGPSHAEADRKLVAYNATLRRLAERHGYRVAEVNGLMREARDEGLAMMEADDVHINFAGYRVIAKAVLGGLGCADVPVPREMKVEPEPGIIREWRVRAAPADQAALDAAAVAALEPDASWKTLGLPEAEPVAHWWQDQERRRGFAMSLERRVGKARTYHGVAAVQAKAGRRVVFAPGAGLRTLWLNGVRLYQDDGLRGWHPGRQLVPAELKAGRNTIVIETGSQFYLSLTD